MRKVHEKQSKENAVYYDAVAKARKAAGKSKGGFLPGRRQAVAEKELFAKQLAAGIKFSEYKKVKVEVSGKDFEQVSQPLEAFADLASKRGFVIPPFLDRNIKLMQYVTPTPIQSYALPVALAKRDLMCCAQTGSGKTCAFLFPIVVKLGNSRQGKKKDIPWSNRFDQDAAAPVALVLAPTRELAIQIEVEAQKLANGSGIVASVVYGGASVRGQLLKLADGVDILVATPGRLQDFADRNLVSLSKIEYLVLDEADRMLDMGFEPQIRRIVERSGMPPPQRRRTFMFSATFPPNIQKLAGSFMQNYIWIGVGRVGSTVSSIEQRLLLATNNKRDKLDLLHQVLFKKDSHCPRTLVFVKKKSTARWVAKQIRNDSRFKTTSSEIHGDRSQSQRESALQAFRDGDIRVLVATDVAARGLDINNVEHVVNFDLGSTPDDFDSYVHRIGRTGRAGNTGLATSFYVPGNDPKAGSGRIAGSLLRLLRESKQNVPQWFLDLPEVRNVAGGARGKKRQFGGHDARSQAISARSKRPPSSPRQKTQKSNRAKQNIKQPSKRRGNPSQKAGKNARQ